ncbi:hypothetical protein PSR1_04457 [Anaeromyxobacter sp. PSR-1]|nr:hypothetical protein PSR1_04457 [Anaeromyxobacter sp. PSR-1]
MWKVLPSGARPTVSSSPSNGTTDRVPSASSMTSFIARRSPGYGPIAFPRGSG